jgi:tetratricopeptide (TPR) repeat protein
LKKSLIQAGLILGLATAAYADFDAESRNLLIEKLDKVQMQLAPNDPSKVAVTLRLADLYAERARVNSMTELEKGCQVCNAGDADRKKALRYYLEVMDHAPEATRGKVTIQVGHLYEVTGGEEKAIQFYNKVLASNQSPALQAEANLSLGEIYFKRRDHAKAHHHYQEVMKVPSASSRGLAAYRMAWCDFNQGRISDAVSQIQEILKTPALLSRNGAQGAAVDPQFQEEVSRDFVTFLSKERFSMPLVLSLFELSPEKVRIQNVQTLALENERIGKKSEALQVWKFIYPSMNRPEDRLSAQISMGQLEFDAGHRAEALANYEKALQVWREYKTCGTDSCEELRKRARQFVVSWNQLEKKNVSAELLSAYQFYISTFPADVDMKVYAAQAAEEAKNYTMAWEQNNQAIETLSAPTSDSAKVDAAKLETLLLKQIEIAELAKNEDMQAKAGDLYQQKSIKKTKSFEVQYQKARHLYEKADYANAVEKLRALALAKEGSVEIRKQAADLSLDGLVLLKDEARLSVWAQEYASVFKSSSQEFSKIVQKSILTKSAGLSTQNQEAAYAELSKFNPASADAEDKQKFYKNKLILAEKLKKWPEAIAAADDLLAQANLSAEDREFAWGRKAYISELLLDFQTALAATEKIQKSLALDDKALKLAIFAELSGSKSEPYYQSYLKTAKDEEQKKLVAAELIRKSKQPVKELEAYRSLLEKNPALYAQLSCEVYAKTENPSILKTVQKDEKLRATEPGKLISRVAFLKSFADFKKKIVSMQLDSKNDRKLAASIKVRAAALEQLETLTKQAIQSGDWTSQLVSLDLLAKESERFYSELLSAPVPAGLQGEEEQQYLSLLSAQAAPFQTKAAAAKVKVDEFWKNTGWSKSLEQAWNDMALRPLLAVEVAALKEIAPSDQQASLANLKITPPAQVEHPAVQVVQAARKKVYQNPFDAQALEELLSLEKKTENVAMVQYLQTRLTNLNKETK